MLTSLFPVVMRTHKQIHTHNNITPKVTRSHVNNPFSGRDANTLRDRPFNLKGGGYGFLFRSEFFFRTTQELEYLFFLSREFFFKNLTLGYMTKTLNQIIFFSLHQNQNIFFSNVGNQNIFLEKQP